MAALCSLTLLVSAFLLFSIQPMVAKMLLPILGGSPSVWNTAMVFYQAALLGGYMYAHLLVKKLSFARQMLVHGVVLALPLFVLPLYYGALHPPTAGTPIPWMLLTMAMSVGLPFFVLSASSPLLQSWFNRQGNRDPYFLYAASNIGSFLGLLSYPFLIEPHLTVSQQSIMWAAGYILLAILFVVTALKFRGNRSEAPVEATPPAPAIPIAWKRRLRWIFLAFIPSSQFIGVTTYLTSDIAVMPLLWVIPLAIYLLTMVFVFAKRPPIPHKVIVAIFPFALAAIIFLYAAKNHLFVGQGIAIENAPKLMFSAHLIMLFIGAMMCHGELAKDRPEPSHLTEFFLWMSFGGVLGGIFNALVAPVLFVQVIEYTLILALSGLALPARVKERTAKLVSLDFAIPAAVGLSVLLLLLWCQSPSSFISRKTYVPLLTGMGCLACVLCAARPLRFALAICAMIGIGVYNSQKLRPTIFAERSFFGVQRVEQDGSQARGFRHSLFNGRIMHGQQIFTAAMEGVPLTYYHADGPLGSLLGKWPRVANAQIAVIGLGVGTTAAWAKPGEDWTFYEIDGLVERIARDPKLFTYLSKSKAPQKVLIGDARLRLEEAPNRDYDIIMVDAFSSDSIPAHLLTYEAVQLYLSKLKPDGILAFHITNRFLNLEPLIAVLGEQVNRRALISAGSEQVRGKSEADWTLLMPNSLDASAFTKDGEWRPARQKFGVVAWTDDYSSLMPLLKH